MHGNCGVAPKPTILLQVHNLTAHTQQCPTILQLRKQVNQDPTVKIPAPNINIYYSPLFVTPEGLNK